MSENGYIEAAREAERHRDRAREKDRRERDRYSEREHRDHREHRSDRDRDREKDRDRDRERRDRDRRDRDREKERRDRDRDRDRERERRERDRDRDKDRDRDRDRDRERRDRDRDRERRRVEDDSERYDRRSRDDWRERRPRSPVNLDDITPISERQRRLSLWDVRPKGYETVTAEQAKLSGLFPLPGAPRSAAMDAAKLQHIAQNDNNNENPILKQMALTANLRPSHSRQSKRALVSNLPSLSNEKSFIDFINNLISSIEREDTPSNDDTPPITLYQFSTDKTAVLLELKTTEDATIVVAYNGIEFGGSKIVVNRPKDYVIPEATEDTSAYIPGSISSHVRDSPNKLSVSHIPVYLTSDQILELLKEFGELKSFKLLEDKSTGESKGVAFCEFMDPQVTEIACDGLNGMELGDSVLMVRRACTGVQQSISAGLSSISTMAELANSTSAQTGSRVLQLLNMILPEDLNDNDEYEDIKEDVIEECSKFGTVMDVKIPRPTASNKNTSGLGKIFVRFEKEESCVSALKSLAGRKFADRTVVTTFFPEENYEVEAF
ncbi:hypothetical protein V1511DRAFT_492174 [Dipodascopsis uninucleata]